MQHSDSPAVTRNQARREFFNERAPAWMDTCYTDHVPGTAGPVQTKIERLMTHLPLTEGSIVADIGCGAGILVPELLARIGREGRLYEVDFADRMIAENRRRHPDPRIRFLAVDVMDLALDSPCDAVIVFACFPHFDDQQAALRQLRSLLAANGTLAIAHFASSRELNSFHGTAPPAVADDRLPDAATVADMLRDAGLSVREAFEEPGFYLVSAVKT